MDAHYLDKAFGKWQDQKISEGHQQWNTCDKATYHHTDPCKEAKCPDPLGLPLDYMRSHGVFEPKKTSKYDLCWFYQVGLLADLPDFPMPCAPATHDQLTSFLKKPEDWRGANLIMAHLQDSQSQSSVS